MLRSIFAFALAAALPLAAQMGQGPKGPQNPAPRVYPATPLTVTVISGTVAKVNLAYGVQYPSIEVAGKTIQLAPTYYLLEKGFEVTAGDKVEVQAAACLGEGATGWMALSVRNLTNGGAIELRSATGQPLWLRNGSGQGAGMGSGMGPQYAAAGSGACFDPSSITAFQGTVESVNLGLGIQMPTVTVKPAAGDAVTLKIGPERILFEAEFEIKTGEIISGRAGKTTCQEEWVALELTNSAGVTVKLRNDDGTLAWK